MPQNNDHFISWQQLHHDSRQLAAQLTHKSWRGVIGIARGGLIPATIVARELNIRLIDSLCIASYDHDQQGEITVLKSIDGDGEGFIIIDDLVDTGATAELARKLLPKAYFVSLYAKPAGRPYTELFIKEFSQDTWLYFPWDSAEEDGQYRYNPPLAEKIVAQ